MQFFDADVFGRTFSLSTLSTFSEEPFSTSDMKKSVPGFWRPAWWVDSFPQVPGEGPLKSSDPQNPVWLFYIGDEMLPPLYGDYIKLLPFLSYSWKWKMGAWKMTGLSPRGPFSTSIIMDPY